MKKSNLLFFISIIAFFLYWQDNKINITSINFQNKKIPKRFNGFRILQVSDIQNKKFGNNQSYLLHYMKKTLPDIIIITGDLIDCNRTNIERTIHFIENAVKIAPIYYVSGNHEYCSGQYKNIIQLLEERGVTLLENKKVLLHKNEEYIELLGISDKKLSPNYRGELKKLLLDKKDSFKILLSHRPENFDAYVQAKIDLSFTGHAHGGQIRIPFIGGLFAPNQGFFPKYTSGVYEKDGYSMIVSRGLGNSIFPFRIFNQPELILVTLNRKE